MKAKYYLNILSVLVLWVPSVKAQDPDNVYLDNDNSGTTVTNNYVNDYDFYYSSRINRFHRAFSVFDYYNPIYTDVYWYTHQPSTWGISIYRGGLGFTAGYDFNYPLFCFNNYYPSYNYNTLNAPYFYSSDYYGYDYYGYGPYYGNCLLGQCIVDFGYLIRSAASLLPWNWNWNLGWNWWRTGYYNDRFGWYGLRPSYYSYNNFYNNGFRNGYGLERRGSSGTPAFEGRRSAGGAGISSGGAREGNRFNGSPNGYNSRPMNNAGGRFSTGEARRENEQIVNRGQISGNSYGNSGNRTMLNAGNSARVNNFNSRIAMNSNVIRRQGTISGSANYGRSMSNNQRQTLNSSWNGSNQRQNLSSSWSRSFGREMSANIGSNSRQGRSFGATQGGRSSFGGGQRSASISQSHGNRGSQRSAGSSRSSRSSGSRVRGGRR